MTPARRERNLANQERRRVRMSAARVKGTHALEDWFRLRDLFDGHCVRCFEIRRLEKDHIVPVYQGGSDALVNLQPICARCNVSKGPEAIDHRFVAARVLRVEPRLVALLGMDEASVATRLRARAA